MTSASASAEYENLRVTLTGHNQTITSLKATLLDMARSLNSTTNLQQVSLTNTNMTISQLNNTIFASQTMLLEMIRAFNTTAVQQAHLQEALNTSTSRLNNTIFTSQTMLLEKVRVLNNTFNTYQANFQGALQTSTLQLNNTFFSSQTMLLEMVRTLNSSVYLEKADFQATANLSSSQSAMLLELVRVFNNTVVLQQVPSPIVLTGVAQIAAGNAHTCALIKGTGGVRCWGYGLYGQLGNGGTSNVLSPPSSDVLTGVAQIAAGLEHTCALMSGTGGLRCWGSNNYGQLGNGGISNVLFTLPTFIFI